MIPAKIISVDPVIVEYPPKPEPQNYKSSYSYLDSLFEYEKKRKTAEVENILLLSTKKSFGIWLIIGVRSYPLKAKLNQSCFIIETEQGKCKITELK